MMFDFKNDFNPNKFEIRKVKVIKILRIKKIGESRPTYPKWSARNILEILNRFASSCFLKL